MNAGCAPMQTASYPVSNLLHAVNTSLITVPVAFRPPFSISWSLPGRFWRRHEREIERERERHAAEGRFWLAVRTDSVGESFCTDRESRDVRDNLWKEKKEIKGGPEPLEKEIHEILGSKCEDRFSDPFFDWVQNTSLVRFSYLLRLCNFCKAPRDMRKFPQKCQKIAGC